MLCGDSDYLTVWWCATSNLFGYLGHRINLEDYIGWLGENFDPSIGWRDLEWIREFWKGSMVLKGILDPEGAREAVRFGAERVNRMWRGSVDATVDILTRDQCIISNDTGTHTLYVLDTQDSSGAGIIRVIEAEEIT